MPAPLALDTARLEKPTSGIKISAQILEPDSSTNNHSCIVPTADQQAIVAATQRLPEQLAGRDTDYCSARTWQNNGACVFL